MQSPFLTGYSSGRNSPYGEQALLLLQSLAEQQGLDCRHYAELYYSSYTEGFEGYMNASTVVSSRGAEASSKLVCCGIVWGVAYTVEAWKEGRGFATLLHPPCPMAHKLYCCPVLLAKQFHLPTASV